MLHPRRLREGETASSQSPPSGTRSGPHFDGTKPPRGILRMMGTPVSSASSPIRLLGPGRFPPAGGRILPPGTLVLLNPGAAPAPRPGAVERSPSNVYTS